MRKISLPTNDPIQVYETCVLSVKDPSLRKNYSDNQVHIVAAVTAFAAATATASWATLPRIPNGNPGLIVTGTLSKKNLMELYSSYMVDCKGPSRDIYDDILVGSGGKCPFCGGIGQVQTLDHYLPKANFPLYSILPSNLIPCCRDCNTGKSNSFGALIQQQTLHPYLDDDKFYNQRWVTARVRRSNPITIEYVCAPPDHWTDIEKLRVHRHFEDYNLSYRWSVQAAAELARIIDSRVGALNILQPNLFRLHLLDSANSSGYDLNGWNRTMYAGLASTTWFCEVDFTSQDWHLE